MSYLGRAATAIVELAEGIDPNAEPSPPARGADADTIRAWIARRHVWRTSPVPSTAPGCECDRALAILGLRRGRGRNVFTSYRRLLDLQRAAENEHSIRAMTLMPKRERGRPPKGQLACESRSELAKKIRAGERLLAAGRIPELAGGPAEAATARSRPRTKK